MCVDSKVSSLRTIGSDAPFSRLKAQMEEEIRRLLEEHTGDPPLIRAYCLAVRAA